MEKSLTLFLKCPHCGESFMDDQHLINNKPGIKVDIVTKNGQGHLWLCPIYGCFQHESDIDIYDNEIVTMNCPHCNQTLLRDITCQNCSAPMVGFNINVGGKVDICSRKGCQNHYIVFEEADDLINLFYEKFEPRY